MTVALGDLDAHEQPAEALRAEWNTFRKADPKDVLADPRIDDPRVPLSQSEFKAAGSIPKAQVQDAFRHVGMDVPVTEDAPIIHHPLLPGLLIIPNLVPPEVQVRLIDLMAHRDLSNPEHTTNMHLNYAIPYPKPPSSSSQTPSFFTIPPDDPDTIFTPRDPSVHKPLTMRQVLSRRLHWVTLGGQYDWTNRIYPSGAPPPFPPDLSQFLESLFPDTLAQAAIVNFYTPGDTMMMHRDVSEEANRGLISLSLGCDGLFMITPSKVRPEDEDPALGKGLGPGGKDYMLLRLRSGDVIYMSEESRYAWHGVPKVVKGTCPEYLEDWPAVKGEVDGQYEEWRGWMSNKRINLNVRQMKD